MNLLIQVAFGRNFMLLSSILAKKKHKISLINTDSKSFMSILISEES